MPLFLPAAFFSNQIQSQIKIDMNVGKIIYKCKSKFIYTSVSHVMS